MKESMLSPKTRYSLIVPCFNEIDSLRILIPKLVELIRIKSNLEVLILDNGSTDGSTSLIKQVITQYGEIRIRTIRKEENLGYGSGLKFAILECQSEIIIWTHGDLQCDPHDVIKAIEIYESSNNQSVVKGFRRKRSILEWMVSTTLTLANYVINGIWIREINAQPNLVPNCKTLLTGPDDSTFEINILTKLMLEKKKIIRFDVFFPKREFGVGFNEGISNKIRYIKSCIRAIKTLRNGEK